MDLILDSNVYLSDIRMESIKFKNLFDYLRRTKSTLVLPRLVREETVAKHRRLLEIQARKAAKEVDQLNRLAVDKSSKTRMPMPNMGSASRSLRDKLMAPAKGVAVRYYPETAGVDVGDIFIRGVHRRRPASNEGEELRDVILWLITIQLAKSEQKQVALVTADKRFWSDTEVHPDIRKDIDKSKVNVLLFRSLEDFIRSSAPTPQPVDEEDVSKVFDVMTISSSIIEVIKKLTGSNCRGRLSLSDQSNSRRRNCSRVQYTRSTQIPNCWNFCTM